MSSTLRMMVPAPTMAPHLPTLTAQAFDQNFIVTQALAKQSSVPTQTLARISATSDGLPSATDWVDSRTPADLAAVSSACAMGSGAGCALAAVSAAHAHRRDRLAAPPTVRNSGVLDMYMHVTDVSHLLHGNKQVGALATTAGVTLHGLPAPAGSILA